MILHPNVHATGQLLRILVRGLQGGGTLVFGHPRTEKFFLHVKADIDIGGSISGLVGSAADAGTGGTNRQEEEGER